MSKAFFALRRLQKELFFEVICGNHQLLRCYADVLTVAEQTLPPEDWKATYRLAQEHVAEFRFNEIPDNALLAWLPRSVLPTGMAALVEL